MLAVIGLDIAKRFFQFALGRPRDRRDQEAEAQASRDAPALCQPSAQRCGDRGMWELASLGAPAAQSWSRSAVHCQGVCEALRQGEQERCSRCSGNLGGWPTSQRLQCSGIGRLQGSLAMPLHISRPSAAVSRRQISFRRGVQASAHTGQCRKRATMHGVVSRLARLPQLLQTDLLF